jgi:hypothetical protein
MGLHGLLHGNQYVFAQQREQLLNQREHNINNKLRTGGQSKQTNKEKLLNLNMRF